LTTSSDPRPVTPAVASRAVKERKPVAVTVSRAFAHVILASGVGSLPGTDTTDAVVDAFPSWWYGLADWPSYRLDAAWRHLYASSHTVDWVMEPPPAAVAELERLLASAGRHHAVRAFGTRAAAYEWIRTDGGDWSRPWVVTAIDLASVILLRGFLHATTDGAARAGAPAAPFRGS
jgi:hypothetical protein